MPALDGLRGVAVLLVLVGHSHLPYLSQSAGAGVVVFFVLSGYLITGLLTDELGRTGRISLRRFYARRARRLLPALLLMVVGVGVIAWAVGYRPSLYLRDTAWVLGYVSNYHSFGSGEGPIRHTWSLAVEEHFYLVWPVVVLSLGHRLTRSTRSPLVLAGIAVALSVWRFWLVGTGRGAWAYFGDEGGAAALLAGAAVAIGQRQGRVVRISPWFAAAGVLLGCVGWASESGIALAILAAPLLIAATALALPNLPRWLAWAPLRGMGRISYGVYLWHYPLTYLAVGAVYPTRGIMAAVFAVAIAMLSWQLVERPILSRAHVRTTRPVIPGQIRRRGLALARRIP